MSRILGKMGRLAVGSSAPPEPSATPASVADDTESEGSLGEEEVHAHPSEDRMHPHAHPSGGLGCVDERLLSDQRAAILGVMAALGRQILRGRLDLIHVSLPVKMFEPRSYLEKITDAWVHPELLEAAARAANDGDHVRALELSAAYYVAGFHRAFLSWRKPFNPLLGETWSGCATYGTRDRERFAPREEKGDIVGAAGRPDTPPAPDAAADGCSSSSGPGSSTASMTSALSGSSRLKADGASEDGDEADSASENGGEGAATLPADGLGGADRLPFPLPYPTTYAAEQVSHHPPISAFSLRGGGNGPLAYSFSGTSEPTVSYGANAVRTTTKGERVLTLHASGTRVSVQFPEYHIKGLVSTAPPRAVLRGTARFEDLTHGLVLELHFGPAGDGAGVHARADAFVGGIWETTTCAGKGGDYARGAATHPASAPVPPATPKPHARGGLLARKLRAAVGGSGSDRTAVTGGAPPPPPGCAGPPLATYRGNWLSLFESNTRRLWTLHETPGTVWVGDGVLPTDSSRRADLVALAAGDRELAQREKERLEDRQRADAKLRKERGVRT